MRGWPIHYKLHDFRHAEEILSQRPAWHELDQQIREISAEEIVDMHLRFGEHGGRIPAGGQSALNKVFRARLGPLGWEPEPRLFDEVQFRKWKMDFLKDRIGVEVSFNHAEAIPWTFTRLNIAGESPDVVDAHRVDVGVALFATDQLKRWARMDSAVGTFEVATAWLEIMRPIMPIPILVVGLRAHGFPQVAVFRGTGKGQRGASPPPPAIQEP